MACKYVRGILVIFFCYILIDEGVASTLITLIKGQNITCLLTKPLVHLKSHLQTELFRGFPDVYFGDWEVTKSEHFLHSPVTDERWDSFDSSTKILILTNKYISFSVCSFGSFIFTFFSLHFYKQDSYNIVVDNKYDRSQCQWDNYTVIINNDNSAQWIWSNGTIHTYKTQFPPYALSLNKLTYKLHNYTFLSSKSTSKNEKEIFTIKFFGKVCIYMFVSLDNYSVLDIITKVDEKLVNKTTINGFNEPNSLKQWRRIVIKENFSGWGRVSFLRSRRNNETVGYWAVDEINFCDHNLEIFNVTTSSNSSKKSYCGLVEQMGPSDANLFCNKTGYLGNNCDLSCEKVLGSSYPNCERHKICLGNESCHCSWGFKGMNCTEACEPGYWGLDCHSACENGCEFCDSKNGICQTCKAQFFGKQCRNILPFVQQPPMLKSVQENSVVIDLSNMQYNANGFKPEFYQIQLNTSGSGMFRNSSAPLAYNNFADVTIGNLSRDRYSYDVRVILIVQNQSYIQSVPVLKVYKKSLQANPSNFNDVLLTWNVPESDHLSNYSLHYECNEKFCPNGNVSATQSTTNKNITIRDMQHFGDCEIKLFAKMASQTQLIDSIKLNKKQFSNTSETELPKNVILGKNKINLDFESCDKFHGPLTYNITISCISEFCQNHSVPGVVLPFDKYKSSVSLEVGNLKLFSSYEVVTSAARSAAEVTKSWNLTTPSGKVINLSIYCRNETTLWLRWQLPHPVGAILPSHRISYDDGESSTRNSTSTSRCEFWYNFVCANITGLKDNTIYRITVNEDNLHSSQPELAVSVPGVTRERAPTAPENLNYRLISESEIQLTWSNPLYMNGPLKEFRIGVSSDQIKNYTVEVKELQRNYSYIVPVQSSRHYNINVWAVNKFEGQSARLYAVIPHKNYTLLIATCFIVFALFLGLVCVVVKYGSTIFTKLNLYREDESDASNNSESTNEHVELEPLKSPSTSNCNELVEQNRDNREMVASMSSHHPLLTNYNLERTCHESFVSHESSSSEEPEEKSDKSVDANSGYKVPRSYQVEISENRSEYVRQIPLLNQVYRKGDTFMKEEDLVMSITDALNEKDKIIHQFRSLSEPENKATTVALQGKNINRNRNRNYVPFDYNRIMLTQMDGMGSHHYINASYINGFDRPRAYIAAQSPKFYTVRDFWRMIWQEGVETIVMATNIIENKTRKCAEYFPQNFKAIECGSMIIKLTREKNYEHYDEKVLEVCHDQVTKKIRHFSMKWSPEYSPNLYPNNIISLSKQIRKCYKTCQTPILVHCSSGVNRTGTLILCDLALQMLENKNGVDFFALLKEMRKQRPNIVKSEQQYVLTAMVVVEYLLENPFEEESLMCNDMPKQLSYLEKLCWHDEIVQECTKTRTFMGNKSYVRADGYGKMGKYVLTRQPNKDTLGQFWKLIVKEQIKCFLFLNNWINKEELQTWPKLIEEDSTTTTISLLETYSTQYCTLSILRVESRSEEKILGSHDISFFLMKNWDPKENLPPSIKDILFITNDINKMSQEISSNEPILVACHDGFTATGLFIVLSYVVEKYRAELIFDVCSGIRMIRRSGPQFRNTVGQMEFIYKCSREYLINFDDYSSAELLATYSKMIPNQNSQYC